jgi:hypothetical protein
MLPVGYLFFLLHMPYTIHVYYFFIAMYSTLYVIHVLPIYYLTYCILYCPNTMHTLSHILSIYSHIYFSKTTLYNCYILPCILSIFNPILNQYVMAFMYILILVFVSTHRPLYCIFSNQEQP